ncbi:hypothetical protein FF32_15625 [Halomonas campaniensis]|nr:hypothetical protein FF32_15625 [Halomonas campaniensis]
MVDQVRFPPSIGGSGKIYTNDANPVTGMFGGGHRINFFPIQSDMIAAAGYVSQYAQAIDGAKANADRAEDAKGYVEAVADAYNVNLLEQFKRKATLGLDFIEGRYWVDDGERLDTNNISEIFSVVRSTPKTTQGPVSQSVEFGTDVLAREWQLGEPLGASIHRNSQNLFLHSDDFSKSEWSSSTSLGEIKAGEMSVLGKPYARYDDFSFSGSLAFLQNLSIPIPAETNVTLSVHVSDETNVRYVVFNMGNSHRVVVDRQSGTVTNDGGALSTFIYLRKSLNGERIELTAMFSTEQSRFGVYFRKSNNVSYNENWVVGDVVSLIGMQLETGQGATPHITTGAAPVTRNSDQIFRTSDGQFDAQKGTFLVKYKKPVGSFKYVLGLGDGNNEEINIGNSSVAGTSINIRAAGVNTGLSPTTDVDEGENVIAGLTYEQVNNEFLIRFFANGVYAGSRSIERLPTGFLNNIAIGRRRANSNILHADTSVAYVMYSPLSFSNQEMQELTSL